MSIKNKINSSFKWRTLNTFFVLFLNGLFIVILSRLVEKEIHGVFVILNTITVLSLLLSESGIGSSLVQNQNMNKYHIGSGNILALFTSISLFSLFVLFGRNLVSFFENKFTYLNVLVLSFNIIINAFRSIAQSLLVKKFDFKKIFLCQITAILIGNFIIGVPLAYLGYGIWAFIIATTSMNLILGVSLRMITPESLIFRFRKKEMLEIIRFGVPATGIQLLSFTNKQLDKLVLGKLFPLPSIAIYEKAVFLSHLPSKLLGDSVDSPLFSYLSKNLDNKREQFDVIFRFFQVLFILALLGTIVLFFFSEEVVGLVLGSSWLEAAPLLRIFAITIPFLCFIKLIDVTARSNFKLSYSFYAKGFFTALIITSIIVGSGYGIMQVTKLITLSVIVYAVIMFFVGVRILEIKGQKLVFNLYPKWNEVIILIIVQLALILVLGLKNYYILSLFVLLDLLLIYRHFKYVKTFLRLVN